MIAVSGDLREQFVVIEQRNHDQLAEQSATRCFQQIPRCSEPRRARRPKFNANHQPFAANRSDEFVTAGRFLEKPQQPFAALRRFFDQPFRFDHLQRREPGRHREIVF